MRIGGRVFKDLNPEDAERTEGFYGVIQCPPRSLSVSSCLSSRQGRKIGRRRSNGGWRERVFLRPATVVAEALQKRGVIFLSALVRLERLPVFFLQNSPQARPSSTVMDAFETQTASYPRSHGAQSTDHTRREIRNPRTETPAGYSIAPSSGRL